MITLKLIVLALALTALVAILGICILAYCLFGRKRNAGIEMEYMDPKTGLMHYGVR